MTLIAPMLATPSTGTRGRAPRNYEALMATGEWGADLKLDGVRALLYWDGHTTRLMNRNGVDITNRYPEITFSGSPCVLDGEVVAMDGSFESVAVRDRQQSSTGVAAAAKRIPVRYIAFDVLSMDGTDLTQHPWVLRRDLLDTARIWPAGFAPSLWSRNPGMLDSVRELGFEGVIIKRYASTYQPGKRSQDWIKFKVLHRVSCIPVAYEPGVGSRAHFGAMTLAMLGPDGPVVVGRVGTGFTETEISELKARLDRAELFVVEIETLNATKGGQLRFPVYKGIRSDLSPVDAKLDQLHQLPTC